MTNKLDLKEFIAKRIRLLRLKKGITQEKLAEDAQLGFNYIYRLENKHLNVKVETIEKIMNALEVDLHTFFNIKDSEKDENLLQLIEDIENLPSDKKQATIKAFQLLLEQIK